MRNPFSWSHFATIGACLLAALAAGTAAAAAVSSAQTRAAEEFLAAVANGSPLNVAQAIHPTELELLRKRVIDLLRSEAERDENGIRTRLFGPATPVSDIERLTPLNFYAALARRVVLTGRSYEDVNWLAAIEDSGSMVHVVGRGRPQRDRGQVRVVVLVSLVPWGKDWKAAIPLEVQAQIDDLIAARSSTGLDVRRIAGGGSAAEETAANNLQPIVQLLTDAEQALVAGRCEEYYGRYMSPNFRRLTSSKAQKTLINACSSRPEVRDTLLAALRAARAGKPRYDYDATRAIYDLRGAGLPFDRFVLEQIDKRWYVAE